MLDNNTKERYIKEVVIPNFMVLVEQRVYSVIFDYKFEMVICTNLSAESIGRKNWQDVADITFRNYANRELAKSFFNEHYTPENAVFIHQYAKKIFSLQQEVFTHKRVVSFIDLLPYGGRFKSYLVTYIPVFHPSGEVVALQSFAVPSRFFSHQDFLLEMLDDKKSDFCYKLDELTTREQEIMFLLANGISQDQMAQILNTSRSTIANIIAKQLCVKFGIAGSNTKLLAKIALQCDYHQKIPHSLCRPYIIVLDEDLAINL